MPKHINKAGRFSVSYLILLQTGFTMRSALRLNPVVSYTTFSPLSRICETVYFLWHYPSISLKRNVPRFHKASYPMESGLSSPSLLTHTKSDQSPPPIKAKTNKELLLTKILITYLRIFSYYLTTDY